MKPVALTVGLKETKPTLTSDNRANTFGVPRDSDMDLSKTRLIDSILAGGGEMGARMRALAWSATVLGPLLSASLAARCCNWTPV